MRSIANRIVGGTTPASSQNGFRSPIPAIQWRTASRVAVSMYGSGRRTGIPIRRRSSASASAVITGKPVCLVIDVPRPVSPRTCYQNSRVARRAPSAMLASFAHAMSGSMAAWPTQVPNPQSVPAMTFSRPTSRA